MALLLSFGGAYALASWDWCLRPSAPAPKVVSRLQASGPLLAGAAAVELKVPFPAVAAGYGPARTELSAVARPLMARAVVLKEGDVTFGVVSVELLLVPGDVADELRARAGLGDVWVIATHTHSSMGGYDARLLAQLAGVGRFRDEARTAVIDAALAALKGAASGVQPVEVSYGTGTAALAAPRSGEAVDTHVTRIRFGDVAQWLMLAAHPTLVPRPPSALDSDYPGALAAASDAGVMLVLQTAGGNARAEAADVAEMVAKTSAALEAVTLEAVEAPALKVTRVQVTAPGLDATRLVPRFFALPGKNFLCASASRAADVGLLELGPLKLAALPAEVTQGSAAALGVPLVSLANGYLGYVEPAEVVDAMQGESKRQYYDRTLLEVFRAGLEAAR